jgi:orotidine-5'-phosphate decarboxylase
MSFAKRLDTVTADHGRFCVGIDPHPQLLAGWGLADDANGLSSFAGTVVDALAGRVAVLKPQSAFFERHGSRGIAVLERTIADARSAGSLVLLDVKRGDVGSTMQAYADAYANPTSPLFADAVTATPYLGFESLRPLLERAHVNDTGVFVVTLTSNPEGAEVQCARPTLPSADGEPSTVAAAMLDRIRSENSDTGRGDVGAVIGATVGSFLGDPAIGGPILVPGMGTQGGVPSDLPGVFGAALPQVLPSSSREILAAGPDKTRLWDAAAAAIEAMQAVLDVAPR